ncbi:MAG: sugar phosphate isomerase/epimerase [Abditibacteriales bacterium]|nr:sugar phosphate isomerase/epimerase [Abditibacteriales bacterium]MDW8366564.1 sugar phosphate isomerase/epimerase family protein [Abditibacteriales bacterium]
MFKLAVITDEISQDLSVAAAMVKDFGGAALEIRSVWDKDPYELEDADIERIRNIAAEHGLKICGIATPFYKCDFGDAEQEQRHLDILRKCIALAHRLDTQLIRVFTFWKQPGTPPWEQIAEKFQAPIRMAEQEDIILGIENEPSTMAANARKTADFLRLVNHPRVRSIWDPGNEAWDDESGAAFPDGYATLKPWIVHVHLKDLKHTPDGKVEGVKFGTGEVDYIGQFKALKADGYDGYLSLETHWRIRHEIPDDLLQRPKGSAFSFGGEEATRQCLQSLREMLATI